MDDIDDTKLIGSTSSPWSNVKSNLSKTWGDLSGGHVLNGVGDVINMRNNPTGNWGTTTGQSNPIESFKPDPVKHYAGPADANGIIPLTSGFNDDAMQHYNDNRPASVPMTGGQDESNSQDQSKGKSSGVGKKLLGSMFGI